MNEQISKPISPKRRRFVEAYVRTWNATEAARQAGYAHPIRQGSRLLTFVEVKAAVAARIKEIAMETDELLLRYAEQARNEGTKYIRSDGSVDLAALKADGKMHLVKSTRQDRKGNLIVEFYDSQVALGQLGRALRVFVDQVDMTQHTVQAEAVIYLPDNGRGAEGDQQD